MFLSTEQFACDCKPLCTDIVYDIEQSQTEWDYAEQFKVKGKNVSTG